MINDEEVLRKTKDGRLIIGEEVDENNKIYYLIKDGDQIIVEDYNTAKPLPVFKSTTRVHIKQN